MILYADIPGERLDAFLARSIEGMSRSGAQKLLEEGCVLRCGKPGKKNDKLNLGDEITLEIPEPKAVDIVATEMTLEVAYEYYIRGFEFLPIDIYESHATKFLIRDGKILPPFVSISGLGESAAWDIMAGREGKEFLSIEEFSVACPKVSKTHIQMLKDAGAFGSLPDTNQVSLF